MKNTNPNLKYVAKYDVFVYLAGEHGEYDPAGEPVLYKRNRRRKYIEGTEFDLEVCAVRFNTCGYIQVDVPVYDVICGKRIRMQQKKPVGYHTIVATACVYNPDPETHTEVNHKDHNPHNNRVSNLEWTTTAVNRAETSRTKDYASLTDAERARLESKRRANRKWRSNPENLAKQRIRGAAYRRKQYYATRDLRRQQAADFNAALARLAGLAEQTK